MNLEDLAQDLMMIPDEHKKNLLFLLPKLQILEDAFQFKFLVTSGYRTWADHKRVYREINDKRIILGKLEIPMPLHSRHLTGQAADVSDPYGHLKEWIAAHKQIVDDADLYIEIFSSTPDWVHFQTVRPKSGNRFFIP